MNEKLFSAGKTAKMLGVDIQTIRRWEKKGLITGVRTPTNYRRFPESEIHRLLGKFPQKIRCAIYARVSSSKQEVDGNLERQRLRLIEYAKEKGYEIIQVFSEQASGINENRKQLKKLIQLAVNKEIDVVLIEFKDRLARFGYSYLVDFFFSHNVKLEAIATKPPQDATSELMEDLLSIITCFAAKLYGKRSQQFKKKIEQVLMEEPSNVGSDKNHQGEDRKSFLVYDGRSET
jgi:predicted site-specific integrase-resolvase